MTTLLFLLLLLLVLRTLGRPAPRSREPAGSWAAVAHRLTGDVLAGVRVLGRLAAARRERIGRPWS
ncbi:hypothetical protein [Blastococcus sp. SYSU DS0619]